MNTLKGNALINKRTVGLSILLLVVLGLTLHFSGVMPFTLDSFVVIIPGDTAAEAADLVLALVILLFVAVFLVLVFSGVGVIAIGSLALVGVVLVMVALPFLLPLLIPVLIIWIAGLVARRREAVLKIP